MAISAFLSPRELYDAEELLKRKGTPMATFGGYVSAERQRIYFLPDYMEGVRVPQELSMYGESSRIRTLQIKGSGFCKLTHRDFLGSLLGLGLERSVIGDICIPDESASSAFVWVEESIVPFLLSELRTVGRDTVKPREIDLPHDFAPPRRVTALQDTVASARLDAVVASLCSVSREKASDLVARGLAELNYRMEERGDRTVTAPAVISVRGYGKFRVLSVSEPTKKGRLRLYAEKYV